VRIAHVLLYGYAANDVDVGQAVRRFTPTVLAAMLLLVGASFLDGPIRVALWLAAIVVDYGGALRRNSRSKLYPGHFAERHGLIVIIAFGESVVATGLGAQGVGLSASVVTAALLALVIAATLWWAYLDVVALVAERHLREAEPGAQARRPAIPTATSTCCSSRGSCSSPQEDAGPCREPLELLPALCERNLALSTRAHRLSAAQHPDAQPAALVVAVVAAALMPVATRGDALLTLALLASLTRPSDAKLKRGESLDRPAVRPLVRRPLLPSLR